MKKFNVFGYTVLGKMVLVKLNAKINSDWQALLTNKYPNLLIQNNGKFGFKIEGCLTFSEFYGFTKDLKVAIIDYKISKLYDERNDILGYDVTEADLSVLYS
jgi:hypothetical protein